MSLGIENNISVCCNITLKLESVGRLLFLVTGLCLIGGTTSAVKTIYEHNRMLLFSDFLSSFINSVL